MERICKSAPEIKGLSDARPWFQALLLTNNREERLRPKLHYLKAKLHYLKTKLHHLRPKLPHLKAKLPHLWLKLPHLYQKI